MRGTGRAHRPTGPGPGGPAKRLSDQVFLGALSVKIAKNAHIEQVHWNNPQQEEVDETDQGAQEDV